MNEEVVTLKELEAGVVQVTLRDEAHKNTFSAELIQGLAEVFEEIKTNIQYKAVILTGYDSYFASGGTQESLLYLSEGKGNFTDIAAGEGNVGSNLYSLALDCPIPVISAMQGHGIGGGFVMGLFADFVILSRESIYTTNFMKYGFTPGMGATFILPHKLGINLAEEMLLTAKTYYGEDLRKRGVSFPVLPRSEIAAYALDLARNLAEKPRHSLVTLKDHLVADIRKKLPEIIAQELVMHEKTFNQPEVKDRINALFGN